MRATKIFVLLIFMTSFILMRSQQLPIQIDSIIIYHVPLSMKTSLSLSDYDIRNFDQKVFNIDLLEIDIERDSLKIDDFIKSGIFNQENKSKFDFSIDVRIVIDLFMEKVLELTIIMDDKGYYIVGNEKVQRLKNAKLTSWLQNYVPELE